MDSHQRPLDFQSNALLLSYLNIFVYAGGVAKTQLAVAP